jgi:hypothetical protein
MKGSKGESESSGTDVCEGGPRTGKDLEITKDLGAMFRSYNLEWEILSKI